ncbi:MAG TPA: hypothetical protein DCL21_06490 [Alphaproteobacteria bacterium]|nr:hypothetical protein [Alphaproteobacteria bacterium]
MYTTISLKKLNRHSWAEESKKGLFLIPTEYLMEISNPDATVTTDMGNGDDQQYTTDTVWQSILKNGMDTPLYVVVYLPNPKENPGVAKIRLESGNHRVRAALEMGITHLPVAAFVSSNPYFHSGNGTHTFDIKRQDVLTALSRTDDVFEPYPHPIDLKKLLRSKEVFYSTEIIIGSDTNGIVKFM